ncbi:MAG: putative ATP-dependent endonuclease of the OLD family [Thermodesulfobacteria bacterium]|nr:AAA family ATPase [Thermodesulfobacteriota bacterium]MCU4137449.1 putative ATP-dependent endonuclease of the OLD family [Thermodesulfobacteriota bacterium]
MHIHKVEIYNFRSHRETKIELSENINVLIGQNNTGKTSFLHALNLAIGWDRKISPTEDDFFAKGKDFDPKNAEPIKIIVEFRETLDERFSDNIVSIFNKAIRFDINQYPNDPIKFFRLCYECKFDKEKGRFVEDRYFVDENNKKLAKNPEVKKEHLNFFPFFYIPALRDINKEIKTKTSFWGRIKSIIDYSDKKNQIEELIRKIDDIVLSDNETIEQLKTKLKNLEKSIKITQDAISLQAFARRSWEILDDLNIYLKLPNTDLSLPIAKHGAGTQNIIVLLIFSAYLEILLPKILDNEETTPIIGIEEPEVHVHPHVQRALFHQISQMKGQKIISTHSPYIVEQAEIYDYIVFRLDNGIAKLSKIPKFKKNFQFRYGLPEQAYENNKFLNKEEELKIKRFVQYRNPELFFASLFLLCEGDTEKIFLERLISYYLKRTPGELGITIIPCDGKIYDPFLKIAHLDAFNIKWIILSDGDAIDEVKNVISNNGYELREIKIGNFLIDEASVESIIQGYLYSLPKSMNFEKYMIDFYGEDKIIEILENNSRLNSLWRKYKKQPNNKNLSVTEILKNFLEEHKILFSEALAEYIIEYNLKLPEIIKNLFDRIEQEVSST